MAQNLFLRVHKGVISPKTLKQGSSRRCRDKHRAINSPYVCRFKFHRESGKAESGTAKTAQTGCRGQHSGRCTQSGHRSVQEDQQDSLVGNGGQKEEEAERRSGEDGGDAALAECTQPLPLTHTHAAPPRQCSTGRAELPYPAVSSSLNFQKPKLNVFACFCLSSSIFAHMLQINPCFLRINHRTSDFEVGASAGLRLGG